MFLNKAHKLKRPLLLLATISLVALLSTCSSPKTGDLVFAPYLFRTVGGQGIQAQIGRLTVPENRKNSKTRLIQLAFVVLKSTAKNPEAPIVFLAGGPGVSGIEHAKGPRGPVLLALREIADVVLLDQRGTGSSEPNLECVEPLNHPLDYPASLEHLFEASKRQARICREQLSGTVDLTGYNAEESADDVNALREALGAQKISLLGSSYGTTLALTIIRRYGPHIHRAVMVGVEGPDQTIKLPANGEKQLLKLADLYKNDPKLGPYMPDFIGMLKTVAERLRNEPVTLEVADIYTGAPDKKVLVTVGEVDLKLMTAMTCGYDSGVRELPSALYSMSQGDYSSLAKWALRFRKQHALVVHAATDCASGVSEERWRQIQAEENAAFLGRGLDFPFPDICEAWEVPQLDPAFRSEIRSDVNALFISGSLDGRTPVSNAEEIKKGFPNSRMVIIEGAAHGDRLFVGSPQIAEVILEFLKGTPSSVTQIFLPPLDFEPLKVRVTAN